MPANRERRLYLVEESLGEFLRDRLDPEIVRNRLVPGLARRFQPDYRSERYKMIVEFDGDQHYCVAKKVLEDVTRDEIFCTAGYRVVRIPYFVQLSGVVISRLFAELVVDQSDFLNFPHGFVADEVVFPANFCEVGIARFESDLAHFDCIKADILDSLRRAAERLGDWRLVYPPSRYAAWTTEGGA